jgi:hypothetical protein
MGWEVTSLTREIMPTNMATETMPAKTERVSFNILPYAPEQQKPGRLPPLDKRGVCAAWLVCSARARGLDAISLVLK